MKRLALLSLLVAAVGCKKSDDKAEAPKTTEVTPETGDTPDTPPEVVPDTPPETADKGGNILVAPGDLAYAPMDPSKPDGIHLAAVDGNPMEGAASFFLKIPAKGTPGPHSHTAGYHAVVVSGNAQHWLVGDKDPKPLSAGSYWYQPGGQAHDDMCAGPEECVLFIMIEDKFDFTPTADVKKSKENAAYTLTRSEDAKWTPVDPSKPEGFKMAVLKGDPKTGSAAFAMELPAGADTGLHSHTSDYSALVLSGTTSHWVDGGETEKDLNVAGTFWTQAGKEDHGDACRGDAPCRVFVHMAGAHDMMPAAADPAAADPAAADPKAAE
jgi:quercetin dioxygenase-like cupin family protein